MNPFLRTISALLAGAIAFVPGSIELHSTQDGNGSMTLTSRPTSIKVTRLTVALSRNGSFDISGAIRGMDRYTGTWRLDNNRQASLSVERLNGQPASGTGKVMLDGRGGFDQVFVSGRTPGNSFGLTFEVGRVNAEVDVRQFSKNAQSAFRDKFRDCRRFRFSHESIGNVVLGNRIVKGDVSVQEGRSRGDYTYTATLGASTATVKTLSYRRR